jgi:DNA-binding NarL/FixJ family response regulator
MSKILIIEDDQYKLEKIKVLLLDKFPNVQLVVRTSFHSGFEEVVDNHSTYDLILLDMSMQNYDISSDEAGGDPAPLAGKSILTQMYFREIPTAVVVVTMYDRFQDGTKIKNLHTTLSEEFPDNYKGYVFFSHIEDKWESDLIRHIKRYI